MVLGQYLAEFTTLVRYGVDIVHVVFNNGQLGKIRKEQRAADWPLWQTSLHNSSFAAYAELCGGTGLRVTELDQISPAIREALAADGPAIVEIVQDPTLL